MTLGEHAPPTGNRVELRAGDLRVRDRIDPPPATAGDLGNVVPFRRSSRKVEETAPALALSTADRPAPYRGPREFRGGLAIVTFLAIAGHGTLYAFFDQPPAPLASVGVISISVELTVGTEHAAGLGEVVSETEAPDAPASAASQPVKAAEPAREQPKEEAKQEVRPEPKEEIKADMRVAELKPAPAPELKAQPVEVRRPTERVPEVVQPDPETLPLPAPAPKPAEHADMPAETPRAVPPKPEDRPKAAPRPESVPSTPSTASSSVGKGRSDADTNYRGLVAAHLNRHKQFPEAARRRGAQGATVITFGIDASGKVTSVAVVRSSGNAGLDEAAQAMVRRASPFPAPPSRQPMTFNVPVSFHIR
jgi:protein TonB